MLAVGVDGCKTGWIALSLRDRKDPEAHHLPTIDALQSLASEADAVAIDILIGLPTGGPRAADHLAREFLGARRNAVFLTLVRDADRDPDARLGHTSRAHRHRGRRQPAGVRPRKILEVERWLPSSPCPVYEVHPEVSFAVTRGASATSKKTWAGMVERRCALEAAGISLDGIGVENVAATRAYVDDILDGTVAAWSAARIARGAARSFPDPPQVDNASGGRMAI